LAIRPDGNLLCVGRNAIPSYGVGKKVETPGQPCRALLSRRSNSRKVEDPHERRITPPRASGPSYAAPSWPPSSRPSWPPSSLASSRPSSWLPSFWPPYVLLNTVVERATSRDWAEANALPHHSGNNNNELLTTHTRARAGASSLASILRSLGSPLLHKELHSGAASKARTLLGIVTISRDFASRLRRIGAVRRTSERNWPCPRATHSIADDPYHRTRLQAARGRSRTA
jgi:hypothetical protein